MAADRGDHVQATFLDLSKAYDRVSIQMRQLAKKSCTTHSIKCFAQVVKTAECILTGFLTQEQGSPSECEFLGEAHIELRKLVQCSSKVVFRQTVTV